AQSKSITETVRMVIDESGIIDYYKKAEESEEKFNERLENIESFFNTAATYQESKENVTLTDFLNDIALMSSQDEEDEPQENRVSLLTLHSVKGLEFPYVIITGLEDGYLPHARAVSYDNSPEENAANLEEERRLLFVGITRAQEELALIATVSRLIWGSPQLREVSPFIHEIQTSITGDAFEYISEANEDLRPPSLRLPEDLFRKNSIFDTF
ncbi:MAG: hypothetical protein D6820_02590, partial [Lentisphaerae bacterium]